MVSPPQNSVRILVNGEARAVTEGESLAHLLAEMELTGKRLAVELNQDIVPRSRYHATALREGDRVEIIQAIGGG